MSERRRALWDYLVHHNTISCKRNLGNINCKMFSIIIISNMKDLKILDPNQTTTIARNDLITSCCTTFQVSETPLYPPILKHNNNNTNISCYLILDSIPCVKWHIIIYYMFILFKNATSKEVPHTGLHPPLDWVQHLCKSSLIVGTLCLVYMMFVQSHDKIKNVVMILRSNECSICASHRW